MESCRWGRIWLMLGFLWFLLGVAWAPSNKLYQQGLIVLFWLPALWFSWMERSRLLALWPDNRPLLLVLGGLVAWAAVSAGWSSAEEPLRELKRLLYVLLFLGGVVLISASAQHHVVTLLQVAGGGLAFAALVALVQRYGIEQRPWQWWRLQGLGMLSSPNIGGYIFGLAMVWWSCLPPRTARARLAWGVGLLALLAFVVMTRSRGALGALLVTMLLAVCWRAGRAVWVVSGLLMAVAAIGYWQFKSVLIARGASYRPQIFDTSMQMIVEHPWLGLGLGSDYQIRVDSLGMVFDHSHNIFTHVAIELGLPGLLCWMATWGGCFLIAWRQRATALGGVLLAMLLFSTLALLFDGASLWDSPRPEWFVTWLPVGLALGLKAGGAAKPLCYHASPSKS